MAQTPVPMLYPGGTSLARVDAVLQLLRARLSVRLGLLFLLVGVLPLIGVGWVALATLKEAVLEAAQRRQTQVGESAGRLVEDAIADGTAKLITLSRLMGQGFLDTSPGEFAPNNPFFQDNLVGQVQGLVEPAEVFLELQYFGGEGTEFLGQVQNTLVADNFSTNAVLNGRAIEFNRENLMANDVVEERRPHRDAELSMHAEQVTLRLSHPVAEPLGGQGAIVGLVDFDELRGTLARLVQADMQLCVVDPAGTELARLGEVDADHLERRLPFGEGWTAIVRESTAAVHAPIAELRESALPWFAGAIVLALLMAFVFATWITRPVTQLRRATEALEGGDLTARAGVDRPDEIGQLGAAFDRMADAVAQLDAAKGEFVATVSHELRTPLTSLRLTTSNLLDGVQGPLDERQEAALQRMSGELNRMQRLVEDLLELARLDAGVREPQRAPLDLAILARSTVEVLEPAARERGLQLAVTGAGNAVGDADMLRRVLTNLLDNAIKFSPEGGLVRVEVAENAFEVADSGPGVASDAVFDAFHQEAQDGVAPPGAGLGLAIVRKLIDLHGGTVRVLNEDGALFRVELPA